MGAIIFTSEDIKLNKNKMGWNEEKTTLKEKEQPTETIEFKSLADANDKRGLKIGFYGDFGSGKTHFALSAKEPIYVIDTELGSAPLSYAFPGKDIRVLDVAESDGTKSYQKIIEAVEFISKQENVGTVVLDSITDLWEFSQEYAKVNIFKITPEDRLKQQWDWGTINKCYQKVLMKLLRMECNLIVTARESEVYAGAGQPTNQVKPKWQKATGFWVDVVLHNTKKVDKVGNLSFSTKIEKCRQNGKMQGKYFPNMDFKMLEDELNKGAKHD